MVLLCHPKSQPDSQMTPHIGLTSVSLVKTRVSRWAETVDYETTPQE